MASFEVQIRRVGPVEPIEGADRIEQASVGGFRVVTMKGRFQNGDLAIYVPEQAVVPDEILQQGGFWKACEPCEGSGIEFILGENNDRLENDCSDCKGRGGKGILAGSKGNRVKPIKLRGIVSEGILLGLDTLNGMCEDCPDDEPCKHRDYWATEGVDVGEILGIEKYVVPIPTQLAGKVYPLAGTIKANSSPDNIKSKESLLIDGEPVVISEKVHGSATQIGIKDGSYFVTSKGMGAKGLVLEDEKDEQGRSVNFYHRAANSFGGEEVLRALAARYPGQDVYVYGEAYPCQNLKYAAEGGEAKLAVFDIRVGEEFLTHDEFVKLAEQYDLPTVPVLYEGPYSREVVREHTDGREQLSGREAHIREGVVVKSSVGRVDDRHGRVILKSISEKYLGLKGLTEYN